MPVHKICRICLSSDIKLFKYDCCDLKHYYEQVMGSKVNIKDDLPQYFCYECAAILHKFHKFKEKCHIGQRVIKELLHKGPMTLRSVRHIRRKTTLLQSALNLITINYKVKTYVIKAKAEPKLYKSERIELEGSEIDSETASVNDNDDVLVEKQESLPLPILVNVDTKIKDNEEEKFVDREKTDELKVESDDIDYFDEREIIDDGCTSIDEQKARFYKDNTSKNKRKTSIEEKEVETTEIALKIEKLFPEDNRLESEEENVFVDDIKIPTDNEEFTENEPMILAVKQKKSLKGSKRRKKGNNSDNETHRKAKKFEISNKKKTKLDPNNWLKFNLNEDEAIEEFKARAQHKRFVSAPYKCNECLKGFSKEDMLNRHIKLRHSESAGPIECRFCCMRFKWKCFLRKHMRQHYTKYKCLRCELVCPLETTALFHEEYHNGVIRKCEHCDEEFKHLTTYYTHLRSHRSAHVCTLCGASFVSGVGLRIHQKIKHLSAQPGVTQNAQGQAEYCKRCDIKFETKKAFDEHLIQSAMHTDGIEDPEDHTSLGPKPRKGRMKRHHRIPTACHICGKQFSTQAAYRKHHLAEHPRTSFFAPTERQICEICGISLAPGSVASHLNTHTREKLYSCDTCGRSFNSKSGMNTHQLTHTSEKPVQCTLCEKRFKQNSSMKLHYRTFHLKQPYPKRNRRKKLEEVSKLDEYPPEDLDDNLTLDRWRCTT